MKENRPVVKPYDVVIVAVGIAVIVAFARIAAGAAGPAALVEIRSDSGLEVYVLSQNRTITVPGPLGESIVEVREGVVYFLDSPCRDRICVAAGRLDRSGQWAACLPNRVFVTVSAREDTLDIDATTF